MTTTARQATIEADPNVPIIRITRDFDATPAQLLRAHTDPELFARWVGPERHGDRIIDWDATHRRPLALRRHARRRGVRVPRLLPRGRPDRIVQTFTFDGQPDGVALETLWFEDLGDGRTRLHAQSLVDSFEGRDQWLASGMETGVDEGYAKLDALLADGAADDAARPTAPADRRRVHRPRAAAPASWDAPGAGRRLDRPRRRPPPGRVVPRVPRRRRRHRAAGAARRSTTTRSARGRPRPTPCRRCSTTRRPPTGSTTSRTSARCRSTRRSTCSTPPTCSCTAGTSPAPPARTTGSTRTCAPQMLDGMQPMDEVLRSSGQYGARVPVPDDADVQTRLLGFIGRDPFWTEA